MNIFDAMNSRKHVEPIIIKHLVRYRAQLQQGLMNDQSVRIDETRNFIKTWERIEHVFLKQEHEHPAAALQDSDRNELLDALEDDGFEF